MSTHYISSPQEELAFNTYLHLSHATSSLLQRLARHDTRGGLTPSQFGVLEVLYQHGPLCQTEISNQLLLSTANITLVIDNLEKLALVQRRRNPDDRRYITVSLTAKGEKLIAELLPKHAAAIRAEMSSLSPEEQRQLFELCDKLEKQG